jgi:hypothetical protein
MRTSGTTLGVFVFSGILALASASVLAQGSGPASTQRLASEYQQLRADLDRVNAEVAALKRGGRSVRTDYLLRDKLAEAEALARKVMAAEARLRADGELLPAESPAALVQTPVATPQDGAVELVAKADLLSDQARRFRAEADTLSWTAQRIRARQALRRRAGAWDRDPLAGFEASNRVAVITAPGTHSTVASSESNGSSAAPRAAPSGDTATKSGGSGAQGTLAAPATGETSGTASAASPPGVSGAGPVTAIGASPSAAAASSAAPAASHPLTAPAPLSTDAASRAAVQQRTLLDPATLAGIRNSLNQIGSLSDPAAVEAAATALRRHARALDEHARRLRAQAGQK